MEREGSQNFKADWCTLADDLGLTQVRTESLYSYLVAQYGDPARYYHSLDHIEALLNGARDLRSRFEHWNAVRLAIVFHDVIYDVSKFDNEHQSALKLAELLEDAIPPEDLLRAQRTIEATQRHEETTWGDTNLMIDLDMGVLGQPWPVYERYMQGVRAEYEPIYGDEVYTQGRIALFLEPTLAKSQIYLTPEFRALDDPAKVNLSRELELLSR